MPTGWRRSLSDAADRLFEGWTPSGDRLRAAQVALREFWLVLPEAPPDHRRFSHASADRSRDHERLHVELQRLPTRFVKGRRLHRRDDAGGERGAAHDRRCDTVRAIRLLDEPRAGFGIETPTRADLARRTGRGRRKVERRLDHPHDPDAKITKMKDGARTWPTKPSMPSIWRRRDRWRDGAERTKATRRLAATPSLKRPNKSRRSAQQRRPHRGGGDKGYHSNQSLVDLEAVGVRSYIRNPIVATELEEEPRSPRAVYRNRQRIVGARSAPAAAPWGTIGTALRPSL